MASYSHRASIDFGTIVEEQIVRVDGEVLSKKYSKGRFLGKGGFARCYEFTSLDSRKLTAVKVVAKSSLTKPRARQKLMTEIKIHRTLHHSYIVGFEHYFEDPENMYIILELCSNQTLHDVLRRRKRLSEVEAQYYISQLVAALKYLQGQRIIHRDLKLSNIFINDKMQIKLGDFGLASKVEFDGERKRTVCGTPNYIAPEVLDNTSGHSYEVDIWALGIILYILLIGKPPFEASDIKTTYRRIRSNLFAFPENVSISDEAKNLITQILVTDPSKRPTLDEISKHSFLNPPHEIPKTLPPSTLACPPSAAFLRQLLTVPVQTTLPTQASNDSSDQPPIPNEGPVCVKKWVDYSSKYGMGYLLSTGATGVFFNDNTKILLGPEGYRFHYFERKSREKEDSVATYTLSDFPKALQKKVTLLQHFRSYLEADFKDATLFIEDVDKPKLIYVKKWIRTKYAILFRLSNKMVQVNFQDKTEIKLSSDTKMVTFVDKAGETSHYPLNSAFENNNQQMAKRLKYTKDILSHMLDPSKSKKHG